MPSKTTDIPQRARNVCDTPAPASRRGLPAARRSLRRGRRRSIAFTLLELLVAVGVSVLLALALAQLFKTTGDTVTQGRRAAYFNSYASMIQRTLAQDFADMSRGGFLLIRHEVTNSAAGVGYNGYAQTSVPLARGSSAALTRPRRIDELMFFTEGRFTSARGSVHPSFRASATQQRVYFGMGAVSPPIAPGTKYAYNNTTPDGSPMINPNRLAGLLGQPSVPGVTGPGPNAFASDWILLRHATLLASPRSGARDFPVNTPLFGQNPATTQGRARLEDKDRQIAGLPAAASIFRALNRRPSPDDSTAYPTQGGYRRPPQILFNSGLVDVATTDLAEVRAYVMQMHDGSTPIPDPVRPQDSPPNGSIIGVIYPIPQPSSPPLPNALLGLSDERDLLYNMHAWMRNAMPTNSHGDPRQNNLRDTSEAERTRIRCADTAAYLPDVLQDPMLASSGRSFQRSDLITNERMLMASNFVPHCTEFIVEWSFGEMDPQNGQTVWYGSSLPQDTNNDGIVDRLGYTYYDYADASSDPPEVAVYQDKATGRLVSQPGVKLPPAEYHPVDPRLIYGQTYDDNFGPPAPQPRPLVAHFGYTDPTYTPTPSAGPQLDTMPWAWPALIRITITLADPTQPTIERTFQFTFQTPPAPRS